jgi:hypothetical protein
MSRHRKDPLRPLTADERQELSRLSGSPSAPAAHVERARALLAIADGASYTAAAHQVGRRHTETISAWVSRFNRNGLAAATSFGWACAKWKARSHCASRRFAEAAPAPLAGKRQLRGRNTKPCVCLFAFFATPSDQAERLFHLAFN